MALPSAARRGEALFRSAKAACSSCHGGPEMTDGKVHVVGLESRLVFDPALAATGE